MVAKIDSKNTTTGRDCGDTDANVGYRLTADCGVVMAVSIRWPEKDWVSLAASQTGHGVKVKMFQNLGEVKKIKSRMLGLMLMAQILPSGTI